MKLNSALGEDKLLCSFEIRYISYWHIHTDNVALPSVLFQFMILGIASMFINSHSEYNELGFLVVKLDFMTEDNLQQSCGLKGKPIHTIWLWEYCEALPVVDSENRGIYVSVKSTGGRTLTSSAPVWSASHCAVTVHLWEQELQRVFLSFSSVSPATLIWKDQILHFIHNFPWRCSLTISLSQLQWRQFFLSEKISLLCLHLFIINKMQQYFIDVNKI